ncbi:hypothetical protein [Bradyrhizobium archetypum]|uniref:Uncharacterized protein n=1 Tax=Bradyrhizobium archetypum TaxID=2721160 RepID=A0A7Y4H684_9BRAD|nr:hypothetical protein [Bradyrhizobium archetypum]NOJ48430.1 hypothetical protein [Bradyrhizobium archetypum]
MVVKQMGLLAMKAVVKVWDDMVEINVNQRSTSVWIATGEYKGKYHEVKRQTRGAAVKGWADAAKYHSN